MSSFIDKLNGISRLAPRPMGFGRHREMSRPRILLVAGISLGDDLPSEEIDGADAVLFYSAKKTGGSYARLKNAVNETPWGFRINANNVNKVKKLTDSGCDFITFPLEVPLTIPLENATGKIVELNDQLSDSQLRSLNRLPVAGAFLELVKDKDILNWQHLLACRRFADLLGKPLLVTVPPSISDEELCLLWSAGVAAVVVTVITSSDFIKLHKRIVELKFPVMHDMGKKDVLLPVRNNNPEEEEQEEEEE